MMQLRGWTAVQFVSNLLGFSILWRRVLALKRNLMKVMKGKKPPPCPTPNYFRPLFPSPPPDLDVTHLQLMLFVWHSFSFETRASLLTTCAQAVVKAGNAKR